MSHNICHHCLQTVKGSIKTMGGSSINNRNGIEDFTWFRGALKPRRATRLSLEAMQLLNSTCTRKLHFSLGWQDSLLVSKSERELDPEEERERDIGLMCLVLMCSLRIQFYKIGMHTGRQADWMLLYHFFFTALPITLVLQWVSHLFSAKLLTLW